MIPVGGLKSLLYLFFPRRCALCGEVVLPQDEICAGCARELIGLRLSEPKYGIYAPFAYRGAVRDALRRLKFRGELDCVPFLARELAETLRVHSAGIDGVCFVPLHKARQSQRGFNQSEELAKCLARELALPLRGELLTRLRDTPSQREFDRAGRQQNVRGAFGAAPGSEIDGLSLLLIDDIATTGATLRECEGALLKAGAKSVLCAAVAATVLRG